MRTPEPEIIRSPQNNLIKRVRSLGHRKHRDAERAFVVEGSRGIATAVEYGHTPEVTLLAHDARLDIIALAESSGAPVRIVERAVFDAVMDTATPQGIAAIFPRPESIVPDTEAPFLLVLDGIGDPGNLGTLIRSAAGAGCDAVILGSESADPWSAKAARSSMGSIFGIPVLTADREIERLVRDRCPHRWLAAGEAEQPYDEAGWSGGVAVIIGSEGHGASAWGRALATGDIRIPLAADVESLNAAVAGSVILFEARRQRGSATAVAPKRPDCCRREYPRTGRRDVKATHGARGSLPNSPETREDTQGFAHNRAAGC
ncbi:MAG: RNA methyltransferase [Thermomicrobiales bacterium]|nr:RNA methyltransferase [Thermomicrobiales bacterium]